MTDERLITERNGRIVTIRLNRPDKLNAIDPEMIAGFGAAIGEIETDPDIRAVVLTGTGRAFSVGADIKAFSALDPVSTWRDWVRHGHVLIDRLAGLRVPTIGAINGYCFGGGLELALALDFCIAANNASFAAPEVKIGTVPGWGGSQRLPRLIGEARAKQMILTGADIDSKTACSWGLVSEVTGADRLMPRATELAGQIAENAPVSVQVAKQLIDGGSEVNAGAALESLAGGFCKATEDGREGLAAFLEKRTPRFKGE